MNILFDAVSAILLLSLYGFVAVLSIVISELARDIYHFISHSYQFKIFHKFHKLHANHHQITKGKAKDFANLDLEKYISSQWQNDIPEGFVMLLVSFILPSLVFFLFNH